MRSATATCAAPRERSRCAMPFTRPRPVGDAAEAVVCARSRCRATACRDRPGPDAVDTSTTTPRMRQLAARPPEVELSSVSCSDVASAQHRIRNRGAPRRLRSRGRPHVVEPDFAELVDHDRGIGRAGCRRSFDRGCVFFPATEEAGEDVNRRAHSSRLEPLPSPSGRSLPDDPPSRGTSWRW